MAILRPFRGITYDPDRVDLSSVVAPPYDVITDADRQRYYAQDPHNVVRLISGEVRATDSPEDNKYVRAASFFNQWMAEGILRREPEPALYVYRHEFVDPTTDENLMRQGIVGVVELEPFGKGILPHERTHPKAKADRLSLTRAVQANLSPIFAMYEDPQHAARSIVQAAIRDRPRFSIAGGEGERHTVWALTSREQIRGLVTALEPSRLFIADGHHRYETALNFRDKMRAENPEAPTDAAFNFVLMLMVDVTDPGLIILPTHRVLHDFDAFNAADFVSILSDRYRVTRYGDADQLHDALFEPADDHRIGVVTTSRVPGGPVVSTPSPLRGGLGRGLDYLTVDVSRRPKTDPVSSLDVTVLHREILHGLLQLPDAALEEERYVAYSRDFAAVLEKVDKGAAEAAFLLRPPAVSDVVAVAEAGQVMPQKSTYFYPKPASGIVFNPLDPAIRIRPV